MTLEPCIYRALEPKTRRLIDKIGKIDNIAYDYAFLIHSSYEQMLYHEENDGPLVYINRDWLRLRKVRRLFNRILRYHLRKYTKKFYFSR